MLFIILALIAILLTMVAVALFLYFSRKKSSAKPAAMAALAAAANPAAAKPAAAKPAADKPAADKPAADKPAADKPAADKPAADKPVAKPTLDPNDPCNDPANCGKFYVRTVQCFDQYGNLVDDAKCSGARPQVVDACKPCPTPQWSFGEWMDVDKKSYPDPPPCSTLEGHSFSRSVECKMGAQKVDDAKCTGARPSSQYFCAPPVKFQFRSGNWQQYWDGKDCGGACPTGTKCCACGKESKTSTCVPSSVDCASIGVSCALSSAQTIPSFAGKCEDLGLTACPAGLQCVNDKDGHICVLPRSK